MSPFSGSIEFKLTIRAFEKQVIRSAQVNYSYTPAWAYYDAQSREERIGVISLDFGLSLLAVPAPIAIVRSPCLQMSRTGFRSTNY